MREKQQNPPIQRAGHRYTLGRAVAVVLTCSDSSFRFLIKALNTHQEGERERFCQLIKNTTE